jgi:molybdenum cofactor guanylyltransferase
MRDDAVAIVPAGGQSRRLAGWVGAGGKAALAVDGESLLGRVCRVLAGEVSRVIVVTAAGRVLPELPPGVEVIFDRDPGQGPLPAIRDGLAHATTIAGPPPRVAVLAACDLARLEPVIVQRLIEGVGEAGCRWVVPVVAGHPQVLLSALAVDCLPLVERAARAGHLSLRQLVAELSAAEPTAVRLIGEAELEGCRVDLASLADIDTPTQLRGIRGESGDDNPGLNATGLNALALDGSEG